MERTIQQFRQTMAAARPWVIVAIILAAGLTMYFATQGVRYSQAAWNNSAAQAEIDRLEGVEGPLMESAREQEARSTAKQLRLVNLYGLFDYPTTDALIAVVSSTAGEAGLELTALTVENVAIEPLGTLQYHVRPMLLTMKGSTANVQEFLAALYDRVPVVVASSAKIVNLTKDPSTQLELKFYLSPEPIPEVSEETAG